MKKSWTIRVGVALVALTLITSCFVGGTFAKYVTSQSATKTARVAKWGVTITGLGETFSNAYTDEKCIYDNATAKVYAGAEADRVVAPGTRGTLVGATITGTPEVDVQIKYTLTDMAITGDWSDGTNQYFPLKITVGASSFKIGDSGIDDFAELKAAVLAAVNAKTITVPAGTNLSTYDSTSLEISWEWEFSPASDPYQTDAKDTALGNIAADPAATTPEFTVTIETSVTQID